MDSLNFFRDTLLEVDKRANGIDVIHLKTIMIEKGYESDFVFKHLLLMKDDNMFNKPTNDLLGAYFIVFGLSTEAKKILSKIRDEKDWKKYRKRIKNGDINYDAVTAWGAFLGGFVVGVFNGLK